MGTKLYHERKLKTSYQILNIMKKVIQSDSRRTGNPIAADRLQIGKKWLLFLYSAYLRIAIKKETKIMFFLSSGFTTLCIMPLLIIFAGISWSQILSILAFCLFLNFYIWLIAIREDEIPGKLSYRKSIEEIRVEITQTKAVIGISSSTPSAIQWLALNPMTLPLLSLATCLRQNALTCIKMLKLACR